jgi:hypothetical protein
LRGVYACAIPLNPPTLEHPWSLIVAFDEFTPGAQLTGKHLRKVIHVFFVLFFKQQIICCFSSFFCS